MGKEDIASIDERLRKVAAQMRKHPEAVNGRIAADLIERELNNADVIDIGGYSHEDLSKLITLHEGNWSISFEKEKVESQLQSNPHDVDVTHITVKYLQDSIRVMAHQFITTDTQGNNYESYIKPVGMRLIKICNDELNRLDEKDRYFPNLISNEEDLKHLVDLIKVVRRI